MGYAIPPAGLAGSVGIVSQSTVFCIGLLTDLRRFGFSPVVSSGNAGVLAATDYLNTLPSNERVRSAIVIGH